jgi:hypothetical protein
MLPTQCQAGLCRAVSDLTFAERPDRDVVTAEAELGVSTVVSGRGFALANDLANLVHDAEPNLFQ